MSIRIWWTQHRIKRLEPAVAGSYDWPNTERMAWRAHKLQTLRQRLAKLEARTSR